MRSLKTSCMIIILFTFAFITYGQNITTGKITYLKTIRSIVDYHTGDTIVISGKIFHYHKDTVLNDIHIDTLTYVFSKQHVLSTLKTMHSEYPIISFHDYKSMTSSIFQINRNPKSTNPKIMYQLKMFNEGWYLNSTCDNPLYIEVDSTYKGYKCYRTDYSCLSKYKQNENIKGLFTKSIKLKYNIYPPYNVQSLCPLKVVYDLGNNKTVELDLISVIKLSKKEVKKIMEEYQAIVRVHNELKIN